MEEILEAVVTGEASEIEYIIFKYKFMLSTILTIIWSPVITVWGFTLDLQLNTYKSATHVRNKAFSSKIIIIITETCLQGVYFGIFRILIMKKAQV